MEFPVLLHLVPLLLSHQQHLAPVQPIPVPKSRYSVYPSSPRLTEFSPLIPIHPGGFPTGFPCSLSPAVPSSRSLCFPTPPHPSLSLNLSPPSQLFLSQIISCTSPHATLPSRAPGESQAAICASCTKLLPLIKQASQKHELKSEIHTENGTKSSHVISQQVSHPLDHLPSNSTAGEAKAIAGSK